MNRTNTKFEVAQNNDKIFHNSLNNLNQSECNISTSYTPKGKNIAFFLFSQTWTVRTAYTLLFGQDIV